MKINIKLIKDKIKQQKSYLKSNFQVEDIGVFGSVARGDNFDSSDIDLLVNFSKPIGMFKFIGLENYLSQLLGKKVDLVTRKALKPAIKADILQEVIYV